MYNGYRLKIREKRMKREIGGEFWEVEVGRENSMFSDTTV
jgi:hypothetical protein